MRTVAWICIFLLPVSLAVGQEEPSRRPDDQPQLDGSNALPNAELRTGRRRGRPA